MNDMCSSHYINTIIPSETSCENMLSSHERSLLLINCAFCSESDMFWYFFGVYMAAGDKKFLFSH